VKTAMILAAGRGERLKPITDLIPKALCQVRHKPLIEYHVERLAHAGFRRVVINHAYLGGQIRRHLGDGQKWNIEICYAPEPPGGLETGGGIVNALPLLGEQPFLTVNADILTDYDFSLLTLPTNVMLKLILVMKSDNLKGDFGLYNGCLRNTGPFIFTGIACYHPKMFQHSEVGRYSIVPLIRNLTEKKQAAGELFTGFWADIGTTERLRHINSI
jgi:MurNAc alpha-1-phosphate uridylyltransferase